MPFFPKRFSRLSTAFLSTSSGKIISILLCSFVLMLTIISASGDQSKREMPVRFAVAEASTSGNFDINVLAIGFNPTDATGNVAERYFNMGGRTAEEAEDEIFNSTIDAFKRLSNNTINYQIVHKTHITSFPEYTNGYQFTVDNYVECVWGRPEFNPTKCEQQKHAFDHTAWLATNNICQLAQQYNADEVWVVSAPYVMTWESFMFGPGNGFSVNGPVFTAPNCTKNYILMDATYERFEALLHIYGHRVESVMRYLTDSWSAGDKAQYWENFAATARYGLPSGPYPQPSCGNAHYPANAQSGYDYENTADSVFTCSDWKNFPALTGQSETINCNVWGCTDNGWQEYWFGALPRSDGEASLTGAGGGQFNFKKNWWYYILFPENAIAQRNAQVNGVFSNLSSSLSASNASFSFNYSGNSSQYIVDLSTLSDMSWDVYRSFGSGSQSPVTVSNPQARWDKYVCGAALYWKVYTSDRSIESPIQTATVSCLTPTPTVTPTPTNTPTPTATPTPAPVTVTLNPTADAYVRSDKQNNNYGTATTMSTDTSPIYYSYLKYNLEPYVGKTLMNAEFKVKIGSDASPATQSIYGMSDTSWAETGVKYSNRPSLGSTVVGAFVGNAKNTWRNTTVTSYLSSRMGQAVSFGISSSSSDSMNILSREASSSNRPQLVLTYR